MENLTREEVIIYVGKENMKEFDKFMFGQTCPIGKDGRTLLYYKCDVDGFKSNLKYNGKEHDQAADSE